MKKTATAIKACVAITALVVLSACGGGGGGGAAGDVPVASTGSSQLSNSTVLLSGTQTGLVTATTNTAGQPVLQIAAGAPASMTSVAVGQIVHILSGQDARFPLGLAGLVTGVSSTPGGTTELTLAPTTLADVYAQSTFTQPEVTLSADNFIGALAPNAVSAAGGSAASTQLGLLQQGVTALNGALVLRPSQLGLADGLMTGVSLLGDSGTLQAGDIELKTSIKLAELFKDEPSRLKPYGSSGDAALSINIKLGALKLIENHDYDTTFGVKTGLKSMSFKLQGKLQGEVKLTGGAEASLGYFSQAWKEVEEQSVSLLGASATLTGLDSKDKIGKFPLVGLVFSVPCPPGKCPVVLGQTQTPLRQAKSMGAIVWLYVTAKGELKFEGSVGARANANVTVGVAKPEGGSYAMEGNLARASGITAEENFVEAPFFEGDFTANDRLGLSVDVDGFFGGVRIANLAADLVGQANFGAKGTFANVLPDIGASWQTLGSTCLQTSYGAGVILSARTSLGLKEVGLDLSYSNQSPSEDELVIPGGHATLGIPAWYTFDGSAKCYPKPVVQTVTVVPDATYLNVQVTGTNLPNDLALAMEPSNICAGVMETIHPDGYLDTKVNYRCVPAGILKDFRYTLSSAKASNLDASAVSGSWAAPTATVSISPGAPTASDTVLFTLTTIYDSIKSAIWNFGGAVGQFITDVSSGISATLSRIFSSPGSYSVGVTYTSGTNGTGIQLGQQTYTFTVAASSATNLPAANIAAVTDDYGLATGAVAQGGSTDDATPAVVGTLSAALGVGQSVRVYDGASANPLGVATVTGLAWTFTPTTSLVSGTHTFTAVVATVDGVEGARSAAYVVEISATTTATGQLNDTGIDWCAENITTPSVWVNNTVCSTITWGANLWGTAQDAYFGRDAQARAGTLTKVGSGMAGFDYTRLGSSGQPLAIQNGTYNPTGSEAAGTRWDCVRDNVTGLIWEIKRMDDPIHLRHYAHTYTWYNPDSSTNGGSAGYETGGACTGVTKCNTNAYKFAVNALPSGQALCGFNDWRVPSKDVLSTLAHLGRVTPSIDSNHFPDGSAHAWSSSPNAASGDYAWVVDFNDGSDEIAIKSYGGAVRLVRSGQ